MKFWPLSLLLFTFCFSPAHAVSLSPASDAKLEEMQRQIDVLGQEIQKLKTGAASETVADQSNYGFGPAASKVYRSQSGVTLGGYGEMYYEHFSGGFNKDGSLIPGKRFAPGEDFNASNGQNRVNLARAVLYAGYKFDDKWVMNSEYEWENGASEISVEFLYFDYFWKKSINLRVGRVLMPMGLTNELHEPTTFFSTHRPTLETLIIPTTWSEDGVGLFGDVGPITYRTYLMTGLNGSGLDASNGAMEARTESGMVNANHVAWVGRADYTAVPGLMAGGSVYIGSATTAPVAGYELLSLPAKIFEVHAHYTYHAWDFRAMGAYSIFSNVDQLDAEKAVSVTDSIGSRMGGFYLQAGYDLINNGESSLTPFVRWEVLNTQLEVPDGYTKNGANLIREIVAGLSYKPMPQIVFKADYQWYFLGDGNGVDQGSLGMGYVF